MALKSSTAFIESRYGSTVQDLKVGLGNLEISGSYATPAAAGLLSGRVHGFSKGYGKSYLQGKLIKRDGTDTLIEGQWRHDPGPLSKGFFEMKWDETSRTMKGWWAEGEDGTRQEWTWTPITTTMAALSEFVQSVHMSRYTVVCCWTFFWFTLVQMMLSLSPPSGDHGEKTQLGFNIMYSGSYISFLSAYFFMQKRPSTAYMTGVLLYTLGYLTFVVLYSIILLDTYDHGDEIYLLGSLLFLSGSLFLILATLPSQSILKYSPFFKGASLFWGSMAFLIGSILFTIDSANAINGNESSPVYVKVGYGVFLAGRLYFLWGSTTPEVSFFLTPQKRVMRSGTNVLEYDSNVEM